MKVSKNKTMLAPGWKLIEPSVRFDIIKSQGDSLSHFSGAAPQDKLNVSRKKCIVFGVPERHVRILEATRDDSSIA